MTKYHAETHERCIRGRTTVVVNLSPEFRLDEQNAANASIEQKLYEIFRKYTHTQT